MATAVIMPALGMAQETGRLVRWLKQDGDNVAKGEPLMEVETDKATVEIEAPGAGQLGQVRAKEGEDVPVGQTIAWLLAPGEKAPEAADNPLTSQTKALTPTFEEPPQEHQAEQPVDASVLARNIATEHGLDLTQVHPRGKRIEKADVLAYIEKNATPTGTNALKATPDGSKLLGASPKARRMVNESGLDLSQIKGSGPGGAVLVADVLAVQDAARTSGTPKVEAEKAGQPSRGPSQESVSTIWRIMAERTTASWTQTPHFYLIREVDATRLVQWRSELVQEVEKQAGIKLTYTDLLVKLIAAALKNHPNMVSSWQDGSIRRNNEINIGLAVAVEDGLVAPVIHHAEAASLSQLATQRKDLVERAQARQLRPADIEGGTFTLSNLGMYQVDAFNAIINSPQAAILAVGRIADRVIAIEGQPAVRPTIILSLSCDHRVVDGARGAQFLDELSKLIENPWRLIV